MSNLRKSKLEALLQELIARFFGEQRQDWGIHELITVDQIFLTPDLRTAQVWVSFIPQTVKTAERDFERLIKKLPELQRYIFGELNMKRVPTLTLRLADPEKSFRLNQIFDTLEGHGATSQSDSGDASGGEADTSSHP